VTTFTTLRHDYWHSCIVIVSIFLWAVFKSFFLVPFLQLLVPVILRVTGHFGHKTLRHQDTSDPHETLQHRLKTLVHQKRGTRHFGIRSTKSRDTFDPGQFRQDTAPPVIWLKLGAEVSWCRNVLWPKCPAPILRVYYSTSSLFPRFP